MGDPAEGRRRAEEALRLSPFDPHNVFTYTVLGIAAYTQGDYEYAVVSARRAYAENPQVYCEHQISGCQPCSLRLTG